MGTIRNVPAEEKMPVAIAVGKLHRLGPKRVDITGDAGGPGLIGDFAGNSVNIVDKEFVTKARCVVATNCIFPFAEYTCTLILYFVVAKVDLGQISLGALGAPRDRSIVTSLKASQPLTAVSIVAVAVALTLRRTPLSSAALFHRRLDQILSIVGMLVAVIPLAVQVGADLGLTLCFAMLGAFDTHTGLEIRRL